MHNSKFKSAIEKKEDIAAVKIQQVAHLYIDNKKKNEQIVKFLNGCGVDCTDVNTLGGNILSREKLLDTNTYRKVKDDIPNLKSLLSSSIYTSMQKNAEDVQRWPLINLVRQILRRYKYELVPKRICDGYTKDGKKKYKRLFEIKKWL